MSDQSVVPSTSETTKHETTVVTKEAAGCRVMRPTQKGTMGIGQGSSATVGAFRNGLRCRSMNRDAFARSPSEIRKLSGIDAICLRQVLSSVSGFDIRAERETLIHRIEGKAKVTTVAWGQDEC